MTEREQAILWLDSFMKNKEPLVLIPKPLIRLMHDVLKNEEEIVRCKDCKHWDKTTRKEGNDCILGLWEDAVCERFRDLDTYGELGEDFRRTNGDWYCADGERK